MINAMRGVCLLLMGCLCPSMFAATWYVRPDGGTRYSSNLPKGQCDGKTDAAYPGRGVNRHCAFNDVRWLYTAGVYSTGIGVNGYGWVIAGGDTVIIRGSIGTGVSYRIGWQNKNQAQDNNNIFWGLPGDPYDSGMPVPPSGTATQHTRILGENWQSCHAASAKTQLHGGYGVFTVLDLRGAKYVDVGCLDITDFSPCVKGMGCNTNPGQLDDYAVNGILWSNTSTNDTLTDVHIHGTAGNGMTGPTGDGVVMSYIDVIGNPSSGWNADAGDGKTGTGKLLLQHYNISWNGCAEEYPIVDALPYTNCHDDSSGGYGDGFGTATVVSNPGWQATFDQGIASYNTQDGLDALHLIGNGSSMTVTRTLAYGNMGQQIKVGGASGTATNNVIVTNCNALRERIPGTPAGYNKSLSDFCRAADTGVALSVGRGATLHFDSNVIYSASSTAIEVDCDTSKGPCDSTSQVDWRNNIFIGFRDEGTKDNSNPIYVDSAAVIAFRNPKSSFDHNVTFHPKSNWSCPNRSLHETNANCGDPHLPDETWHRYGFNQLTREQATTLSIESIPR